MKDRTIAMIIAGVLLLLLIPTTILVGEKIYTDGVEHGQMHPVLEEYDMWIS